MYLSRVQARIERDAILAPAHITVSSGLDRFDHEAMKTPEDVIQAADAEPYRKKGDRTR